MRNFALFLTLATSLSAFASTKDKCPNLTGKFLSLPTEYSTLTDGYAFTQEIKNNELIFHVSSIVGPNAREAYLVVDSEESGVNPAVGHWAIKVFCAKKKLFVRESGLGEVDEKSYGLDEDNNLIVTHGSGVGPFIRHDTHHVFPRVK